MFFDLNVEVAPDARREAANVCARLGYDVIAFNQTINTGKVTNEHAPLILPELNHGDGVLPFDPQLLRVAESRVRGKNQIRLLSRITVVIEESSQLACLNSPILSKYDLVAAAPMSEKLLQQCLQFDIDIISLSFSRQNFFLKRPQVHVAKEKGIVFEICYSSLLSDQSTRRSSIANGCSVTRATGGKHMIVASGAKSSIHLRGPHDIINLANIFGFSSEHARNAVCRVSEETVIHGDVRSRTFKGVVRCLDTREAIEQGPMDMSE